MKKVSLLAFLLATVGVTAASADPVVPGCPKPFQGFGLLGKIGYDVGFGNEKARLLETRAVGGVNSRLFSRRKSDLGFKGVDGGIGVDYTHRLCNWALGIEFDATWANTNGKRRDRLVVTPVAGGARSTYFSNVKVRLRNSLQLFGKLGYVIGGQVMPYVGLGWDNSAWKLTAVNKDPGITVPERGRKRRRINALLWTAGVDFLTTKHTVLGFRYTGTSGGSLRAHSSFPNGDRARYHFKPQNNQVALTFKVIY